MIKKLKITILVDNRPGTGGMKTEHGYSLWIEADEKRILFDAGQTALFLENAEVLGIDPATAETVVLSHGHFDHTGGLTRLLTDAFDSEVCCCHNVVVPRYSRQPDGRLKMVGITGSVRRSLVAEQRRMKWVSEPYMITHDIGVTGKIPRKTTYEDTGGQFFLDPEAQQKDLIPDDMAMWFATASGTVVVTGCGHSGIVNTVDYIQKLTDAQSVSSVIGGFHLLHATDERLEKTCHFLENNISEKLIPCHCTGDAAVTYMKDHMTVPVVHGYVGMVTTFQ